MTLQVSFEDFAETVKRLLGHKEAFVSAHNGGSLATAAKPEKAMIVASVTHKTPTDAASGLEKEGMTVSDGTWLTPEEVLEPAPPTLTYVAAVSYRTGTDKAGVWVDAYPSPPTQMTVLKAMFDEFRETGEVDDVPFEEFVQVANPNVVIVTPADIQSFLNQKEGC